MNSVQQLRLEALRAAVALATCHREYEYGNVVAITESFADFLIRDQRIAIETTEPPTHYKVGHSSRSSRIR